MFLELLLLGRFFFAGRHRQPSLMQRNERDNDQMKHDATHGQDAGEIEGVIKPESIDERS